MTVTRVRFRGHGIESDAPWEQTQWQVAEWRQGKERVLVFARVTATGVGSGIPVELRDAHELTFRDGLLVRLKVHADRDAALEAAGMSE